MVRFPELEALGVRAAAMTTRSNGDMALKPPTDAATVCANRARVAAALGTVSVDFVCARQVHGARIHHALHTDRGRGATDYANAIPDTDGFVTVVRGLPIIVGIADCVPLFLVAPGGCGGALLHAGRAGTRANIAGKGIVELCRVAACSPEDLTALIGPSAGPTYEVSEAIAEDWREHGLIARGRCLDLWRTNALQLETSGVASSRIHIAGECTMTSGRFFSYRGGDGSARNMAVLVL